MLFLSKPVSYIIQYLIQNSKFSTFTIAKKTTTFQIKFSICLKTQNYNNLETILHFPNVVFAYFFPKQKTLKYTFPKPQPDFLENDRTTYAKNFQFIIDTWASDDYSMTIITAK